MIELFGLRSYFFFRERFLFLGIRGFVLSLIFLFIYWIRVRLKVRSSDVLLLIYCHLILAGAQLH